MRANQVIDLYAAGLISRAEMITGLFVAPDADGDAIADYLVDDVEHIEIDSVPWGPASTLISWYSSAARDFDEIILW